MNTERTQGQKLFIEFALMLFIGATITLYSQNRQQRKAMDLGAKAITDCDMEAQRWFDSTMKYEKLYYNKKPNK